MEGYDGAADDDDTHRKDVYGEGKTGENGKGQQDREGRDNA